NLSSMALVVGNLGFRRRPFDLEGLRRTKRYVRSAPMRRKLPTPWKPTKAQILAAKNKLVPDLIAKNLVVLFVGINPGLYTADIGHHFGRPGNRFWACTPRRRLHTTFFFSF